VQKHNSDRMLGQHHDGVFFLLSFMVNNDFQRHNTYSQTTKSQARNNRAETKIYISLSVFILKRNEISEIALIIPLHSTPLPFHLPLSYISR
jgi:hypothetical protein